MLKSMNTLHRGFTLVEILVVISVIIILSSIAIIGWESMAAWSRDRAREQDTSQWASTFDLYKSRFVVYPIMPTSDNSPIYRCLGTPASFPNTKCAQYNSSDTSRGIPASDSAGLEAEILKIGKMPVNSNEKLRDTVVGPVLRIVKTTSGSTTTVDAWFINFFENSCPKDFVTAASQPSAVTASLLQGLSTSNMYTCMIKKQFQFTAAS